MIEEQILPPVLARPRSRRRRDRDRARARLHDRRVAATRRPPHRGRDRRGAGRATRDPARGHERRRGARRRDADRARRRPVHRRRRRSTCCTTCRLRRRRTRSSPSSAGCSARAASSSPPTPCTATDLLGVPRGRHLQPDRSRRARGATARRRRSNASTIDRFDFGWMCIAYARGADATQPRPEPGLRAISTVVERRGLDDHLRAGLDARVLLGVVADVSEYLEPFGIAFSAAPDPPVTLPVATISVEPSRTC